jgi:hypothetical protein
MNTITITNENEPKAFGNYPIEVLNVDHLVSLGITKLGDTYTITVVDIHGKVYMESGQTIEHARWIQGQFKGVK